MSNYEEIKEADSFQTVQHKKASKRKAADETSKRRSAREKKPSEKVAGEGRKKQPREHRVDEDLARSDYAKERADEDDIWPARGSQRGDSESRSSSPATIGLGLTLGGVNKLEVIF